MKQNPFREFVQNISQNLELGRSVPLGGADFPDHPKKDDQAPVGMIFSPHPDDECISGGFPLRLSREAGFRIINVPVTLGSDIGRRKERTAELENACRYLGFEIQFANENGFEDISPDARDRDVSGWSVAAGKTADLINRFRPRIIFFPHRFDRHPEGQAILMRPERSNPRIRGPRCRRHEYLRGFQRLGSGYVISFAI